MRALSTPGCTPPLQVWVARDNNMLDKSDDDNDDEDKEEDALHQAPVHTKLHSLSAGLGVPRHLYNMLDDSDDDKDDEDKEQEERER